MSAGVESEVSGGFPVIQGTIRAQFHKEVQAKVETKTGEKLVVEVPPRRVARVRYGAEVRRFRGVVMAERGGFSPKLVPGQALPPDGCDLVAKHTVTAILPTGAERYDTPRFRRIEG